MPATDIITLEDAERAISMTGSGAQHGHQLSVFVSAVSELLDDICGPVVYRTVTDELYDANGKGLLYLRSWPVASVTTVTEYVSGVGTALTAEDIDTEGGFRLRDGVISRRSGFYTTSWSGIVSVTYVAGRFATTDVVDAKFKLAAQEIIAREWPQYASAWSRGGNVFDAPEGSLGFFRSVEPVVEQWLASERRPPAVA